MVQIAILDSHTFFRIAIQEIYGDNPVIRVKGTADPDELETAIRHVAEGIQYIGKVERFNYRKKNNNQSSCVKNHY